VAMMLVGKMIGKVDIRLILSIGLGVTILAQWQMTGFSLLMGVSPIILSGITQGFGLGFIFVPLSVVSFSTLDRSLRNEGTAIYGLVRNIGSSMGISIVEALLSENTQRAHASMIEHLRPDNPLASSLFQAGQSQLAMLNAEVTRQAAMIAYIDDFHLMMIIAIASFPLLLLLRDASNGGAAKPPVME